MLIVHSSDDHDDFDDGVGDDVGDDLMMKDCRRDNEGDCLSTSGGGPQVCSQMMMMILKIKTFKIMIIIIILLTCYQNQLGQPHDAAIHNVTVENLRYNDATSTLRWITVGLQGRKHRGRLCGIFQCCFWGDRP